MKRIFIRAFLSGLLFFGSGLIQPAFAAKNDVDAWADEGANRNVDILRIRGREDGSTTNFVAPGADNSYTLGTDALDWATIYGEDLDIDDDADIADDLTVGGDVSSTGGMTVSSITVSPNASIQTMNFSSHTIVPRSSFVLLSSTGDMVLNSSLAASISTVSVSNGFVLTLLSTSSRISIPAVGAGGEAARVYSSTGGLYVNITTMTPVRFEFYGNYWRNVGQLR